MKHVDVIVPVYDGLEETQACIESVQRTLDVPWARVVVINDGSPNPRITQYLREVAQQDSHITLLENDNNRGFVATANRGMAYDDSRDVLLLNSDVEVAGDWLERIRNAAYSQDSVGSVTPFSNNATICSFPNFCKDNELLFNLDCAELDACFASLFADGPLIDVPTGVGFCMYIRRDALNEVGLFNEELFGRGYGEENDWCQRALAAQWRNVLFPGCFVYHKGGVSFGETQKPAVAKAMKTLDQCYPDYHRDVQAFIAQDPARTQRLDALLTLFAQAQRPKIVMISHSMGGGAAQHVDELARLYRDQALFLHISPEAEGQSVRLCVYDTGVRLQDGLYFELEREYDKLLNLLRQLGVGRIHFHHTMGLHPRFWGLAKDLGCEFDFTVHDYYLVNGNPTLTDASADFVGDFATDFDQRCAEHYPLPESVDGAAWRQAQLPLVSAADRLIFPSQDCAERFGRFFPADNARVVWHPDRDRDAAPREPQWRHTGDRPLRVLVLGAISREKGADILDNVASSLASAPIEFHLLGYAYRALPAPVVTHGPYSHEDVDRLIEEIAPDVMWFPARWPETYSYTLSTALRLGLPVVVPDIGAFSERVAGRDQTVVVPWDTSARAWKTFWQTVLHDGGLPVNAVVSSAGSTCEGDSAFYQDMYLAPVPVQKGDLSATLLRSLQVNHSIGAPVLTPSEKLLAWLWRHSRSAWLSRFVSLVPFSVQRALKRRLSRRAMHDIVRGN